MHNYFFIKTYLLYRFSLSFGAIGNFGDSSQLTDWILDSGATCYMTPEVSYFIPGALEETDNHIEVSGKHHVIVKQKGQVQIKMCGNHGDPFIATLHNVLLAPNLCDRLF